MLILSLLALLLPAGFESISAQQCQAELQRALDMAKSPDVAYGSKAGNPIKEQLLSCEGTDRDEAISWLIAKLASLNADQQRLTGDALSNLGFAWTSSQLDADTKALYDIVRTTRDPLVKKSLDTALASAQGLYFDAIRDYNSEDPPPLAEIDAVARKFERMAVDFRQSLFAANAAFHRGQYWSKLGQDWSKQPEYLANKQHYLNTSNAAFDSFSRGVETNAFTNKRFDAAGYYFRALNSVLLGDEPDAVRQLKQLSRKAQEMPQDGRIYVYQLFYSHRDKSALLDAYFPVKFLADETAAFIEENPRALPGQQRVLAKCLITRAC